ncbi:helix-turn-helix domain-containing protein [Pelobacter propionicus]|uniref:Transcriptional regulator, XRE family n=1 Tax=Pelobacter propionicus (strain DSM 2379 / NBRC 103807 / OttBd1) TaxID=338966 RepID=A0R840_PELPD|nr:helix-turn-helix transcriptional regulator [Pelobacter propionicus]ABL01333.1 transcriptional regulator, XRE family [Pelobacter propionicus DSM 2379]
MENIDKIIEHIGTRLKEVRNILGMSQTAIAKAADSSLPSWQGYEAGKNIPGGKVLEALSKMGIDVNWVLTGNGKMMLDSSNTTPFREDIKLKVIDILESMSEPNQWRAAALLLEFKEELSKQAAPAKRKQ